MLCTDHEVPSQEVCSELLQKGHNCEQLPSGYTIPMLSFRKNTAGIRDDCLPTVHHLRENSPNALIAGVGV